MAKNRKESATRVAELTQRFINGGLEALSQAEALELLLSYVTPREDNRTTSQNLLKSYGSLRGALSAPMNRFQRVNETSNSSALLFSLVNQSGRQMFLEDMEGRRGAFSDIAATGRYFIELASCAQRETFYTLCLDRSNTFLSCAAVTDGTLMSFALESRPEPLQRVVECALQVSADAVIVCHYQPDGKMVPSPTDDAFRRRIRNALDVISLSFRDYMIVTDDDFISMAETEAASYEEGIFHGTFSTYL